MGISPHLAPWQDWRPALQSQVLKPLVPRPTRVSASLFQLASAPSPTKPTEPHTDVSPPSSPPPPRKRTRSYGEICADPGARSVPGAREPPPAPRAFSLPPPPQPPKPWGSARRAGRGRGGCRAAPAQKAESSSEEARFVIAVPTVPWRSQWEPLHCRALVPARPGPAPRYGVPLGPSLGAVLQSGRC